MSGNKGMSGLTSKTGITVHGRHHIGNGQLAK